MIRACLIIFIVHLCFIFQGCATSEHLEGSSKEEAEEFKMTKEEMWNEMERLKVENANLQRQIDTLREENQRIRDENENKIAEMRDENENKIAEVKDENELLNEQINKLKEENKTIGDENQVLTEKLTKLQLQYELEKDIGKLRVKVLSGDGDLSSAKEMAKKLKNMGYQIKLFGYAPRSNFFRNTVFFAPKFQKKGKHLAFSLGGNTISKPLSWSSIFDLIVVTGKSP
jgi:phage host-nuclease inhibitor protein Gam